MVIFFRCSPFFYPGKWVPGGAGREAAFVLEMALLRALRLM